MLLSLVVFAGVYVLWRYIAPLALGRGVRVLLGVGVLLVLFHLLIISRFFGSLASPEVPAPLLWGLSAGFFGLCLFALGLMLRDALAALLYPFARRAAQGLWQGKALAHGMLLLSLGLGALGVWQAVKLPAVRQVELAVPGLPAAFDGYRIVHLTDLHMSRLFTGRWVREVVARSNALQPDAVLLSGDLVDGKVAWRAADYPHLAGLQGRDGVYAVPGNHEYYADYVQWMQVFEQLGLQMLVNRHVRLQRGDATLVVAGVSDGVALGRGFPGPDIAAALAGRPADAPVILLAHRPGQARAHAAQGVALQLSGHTHGGHVLGLHRLVARFNGGFVSGLYRVGGLQLYVSNGAGLWPGFPIRLGKPSEITLFTLRQQKEAASP